MWTQTLVIHLIRTERVPFVGSRASLPLVALGAAGIAAATALPFTTLGRTLDFCAPAPLFALVLCAVVVGYTCLVCLVKKLYIRRNGSLLCDFVVCFISIRLSTA